MKAKAVRFKILINNSETQLKKNFFVDSMCFYCSFKKYTCFKGNYFSLKLFWIFTLKIDINTLDPDPNCAKILDPDPNSMYLDPQH